MRRPAVVLLAVALVVLTADLIHKAALMADRGDQLPFHERTLAYAVAVSVAAVAWCAAIVVTRSVALAVPGGLVLGGAAGNVASWALWPSHDGTPNTLFLGDRDLGLAFNLADAFVVGAVFVVLPVALTVFVLRHRDRLHEPIRWRA